MVSLFEKEYGSKPIVGIDALYTYYSAILLSDAISSINASEPQPEVIISEIRKRAKEMNLILRPDGTFYFESAIANFQGGTIVEVK